MPNNNNINAGACDQTYENLSRGIVYVQSGGQAASANLSRFNVSPPFSSQLARPHSRARMKQKKVSWVADRKTKAKDISDDRKVVKTQVDTGHMLFSYLRGPAAGFPSWNIQLRLQPFLSVGGASI